MAWGKLLHCGHARRLLASGPGWRVADLICTAGPGDPAFEERHESVCVAVVTEGTFQYRSELGVGVLAPGALLLGNPGTCFECGHEHAIGDRCLSFHYEPGYFEEIVSAVPGARRAAFSAPSLPPLEALLPLVAAAEAARTGDAVELEEITLRLAGAAIGVPAKPNGPPGGEAATNGSPQKPCAGSRPRRTSPSRLATWRARRA